MSIFKGIGKIINNIIILNKKSAKNVTFNTIKLNKTFTHSIRVKNPKKEPGEVIKWVLLVRL